MTVSIHPVAKRGFAKAAQLFGERPIYSAAACNLLFSGLSIRKKTKLLELGAGTGRFTAQILSTGADIVAIEPLDEMRRLFGGRFPTVSLVGAVAEELPFRSNSFEIAVAAEAFHWFQGPEAISEIHRVLKSRGGLGLIWNTRDIESAPSWLREIHALTKELATGVPTYASGKWRDVFASSSLFGEFVSISIPAVRTATMIDFLSSFESVSWFSALSFADKDILRRRVQDILSQYHGDDPTIELEVPYLTDIHYCWAH